MKRLLALLVGLTVTVACADTKISQLPAASAQTGSEVIPEVQTGSCAATGGTCKATVTQLQTFILLGNAATASALQSAPTTCGGIQLSTGVIANGNAVCRNLVSGDIPSNAANTTGNANTATALQSAPTTCGGIQLSTGVIANGNAVCRNLAAGDIPNNSASTSGNAATATALASTPTQCTGINLATGVAASGNANCRSLTSADIPNNSANTSGSAGSLSSTATVPQGGTGLATITAHSLMVGNGTSAVSLVAPMAGDTLLQGTGVLSDPAAVNLVNCADNTHALAYSTTTHTFSCQAINIPSTPYSVPNGGTGVATLTAHGVLLGEGTSNVSSVAAMSADTLLQGTGATSDPAAVSVPNCNGTGNALSYSTGSHTFSCNSISGSGAVITQVFKSGNTTRGTASPTADPDLVFPSVVAGFHSIRCVIAWTNAGTVGNLRYGIVTGGTLTSGWMAGVNTVSTGGGGFGLQPVAVGNFSSGVANISTAGNDAAVFLEGGFVTSTAGIVQFGWAEQNTDATNQTTVRASSYCALSQ